MFDKKKIDGLLKSSGLASELDDTQYNWAFNDAGLDSLDVYSLLSEIETQCGINVSDADFEGMSSLNDLIAYLNKN